MLTTVSLLLFYSAASYGMLQHGLGDQLELNGLGHKAPARISESQARDWIKVTELPPKTVHVHAGESLKIDCEVLGAPTPEIQWLRGNEVLQQTAHPGYNNHLLGVHMFHAKAGVAKIRSRLVLDCVTPQDEGFYTCKATAGGKSVTSTTVVILQGEGTPGCAAGTELHSQAPTIVAWNPTAMEHMGVDVVLPCTAVGTPRPQVYWFDEQKNPLQNYRFQVLPNGDLAISSLMWEDMGQYTCVAANDHGRDSATTFVYPVSVHEQEL